MFYFLYYYFFFYWRGKASQNYVVHKLKMVFRTVRQSKQMSSKNPQKRFSKCKTFIWWMFLYVHISWRKKWVDLGSYWILVIFHSNKQTSYKYFNDSDLLIKYKFEYYFDLTTFNYDSNQNKYDDFNAYVMNIKENFSQFSSKLDNFHHKE